MCAILQKCYMIRRTLWDWGLEVGHLPRAGEDGEAVVFEPAVGVGEACLAEPLELVGDGGAGACGERNVGRRH